MVEWVFMNLKELHRAFPDGLYLCRIRTTLMPDCNYYEYSLHNEDGELACLHGEKCYVVERSNGSVKLVSYGGDSAVYFTLLDDEFEVAIRG